MKKESIGSNLQSSPKPGEIIILPTGEKRVVGIDGETSPYHETGDAPFELVPDLGDDDGDGYVADSTVRLAKGAAVKFQFADFERDEARVARHFWHGIGYPCLTHTSPELLGAAKGRPCPLCEVLDCRLELLFPVFIHAEKTPAGKWQPRHQNKLRILKFNQSMWEQLGGILPAMGQKMMILIVGRNDDQYGSYYVRATDEPSTEIGELARPTVRELEIEDHDSLAKFANTIAKSNGINPQPGRVEKWRRIFPDLPFVGVVWGRKKPARRGYLDESKVRQWMRDKNYLKRLDEDQGIALLLTDRHAVIDLDRDEDIEKFAAKNSWCRQTQTTCGGRGEKYWVRIKGEHPKRVVHVFEGGEHVGEFRGAQTAILDGLHPSGRLYTTRNEGRIVEITYDQIRWPDGWKIETPQCREFSGGHAPGEGGLLDLKLLKNVHQHPTKDGALQAQCPACAEGGSDKTGNHLILFDGGEGPFGCVVDQSAEHYSRIFALAKADRFRQRERQQETVEKLAALDPIAYDNQRIGAAADLGIRIGTLDGLVDKERSRKVETETGLFTVPEPWPEPVPGEALLDDIIRALKRFSVLSPAGYVAVGLCVLEYYAFKLFQYCPILSIRSPEKRCGKSTLLRLLAQLVPKPLSAANVTAAVLYRAISRWGPTLALDEWDSQSPEMQEANRNVLNSGFEQGGCTWRCVGDDHEPTPFPTFCPKVVAGIGELPETAASRAVTVTMHRRLPGEKIERLRGFDGTELRRKCVRWVQDNQQRLLAAKPVMPEELDDREQDIWEPLLAVADLCGEWGPLAREAALELCKKEQSESLSTELLRDIRAAFTMMGQEEDRLRTEELLRRLNEMDDGPWPTFCDAKPLHAHRLSKMLARFGIAPRTIRIGRITPKGYTFDQFEDAWARYLPNNKGEAVP